MCRGEGRWLALKGTGSTPPGDGLLRTDGDTLGAGAAEVVVDVYSIIDEGDAELVADVDASVAAGAFGMVDGDYVSLWIG